MHPKFSNEHGGKFVPTLPIQYPDATQPTALLSFYTWLCSLIKVGFYMFVDPCRPSWRKDGTICRRYFTDYQSWSDYSTFCKKFGYEGSLITIKDSHQRSMIRTFQNQSTSR